MCFLSWAALIASNILTVREYPAWCKHTHDMGSKEACNALLQYVQLLVLGSRAAVLAGVERDLHLRRQVRCQLDSTEGWETGSAIGVLAIGLPERSIRVCFQST